MTTSRNAMTRERAPRVPYRPTFLLIALLAVCSLCPAATPPATEGPADLGALRFRRVYFPDGVQEWPQGNVKYLPMDGDEFERLLAAIQRTAPGAPPQASVGFVQAQYEARLIGQSVLQGSGTLEVSPSIAGAMLMTLDPCNLAIARAQWVSSDGAPAVLGITGDGTLQVLAERGGRMKFDWSLAGQRDAEGGVDFAIALPPSPVNRLLIELPAELTPTVDHGIVADEGPTDLGFHRFRIELGGRPGCRLRLAKAGSAEVRPQAVLASQSTTYDFSLRGVELSVKLNIEAHREPLRKVTLGLDPALELLDVSAGSVSLAWNLANRGDTARPGPSVLGAPPGAPVTIEIPAALQEGAVKLQLRAMAPLSMAGPWKLPRIDFTGIVLRSDAVRLLVPSPLCIERLETRACRQTGVSPLKTTAGEQLEFEAVAGDAAIEVSLVQRPSPVQALSATATVLGQGKMSSRIATDFRTSEGPVFALEAIGLRNWTIDSVESQPTDGLDDWTLEALDPVRQKLSVRLARPLTSARPLRLIILARRLYPVPGRDLGIDDLVPLRFGGLAQSTRWVTLNASGSNELHFTAGDHLRRADIKELTAAEFDLFPKPLGDLLFLDDAGTAGLRLSVENRRPNYSATVRVEALAGDAALTENYAFVCRPSKSSPIDRVVVRFAGQREGRLTWSVTGMDESRFSTRRWSAEQESGGGTAGEETWDVTLHSPQTAPLEIRASRKSQLGGPTPVCLAWLPEAAQQDAALIVRSLGPQIVEIKTHRLKPLPTEAAPAGQVQTARASYQYEPKTEAAPQPEPAIVLTPVAGESAAAWVWDCKVRSQVAADGTAEHVVSYLIQNAGSRQVRLTLPDGLARRDLHGVLLRGKPVAVPGGTDPAAGELTVDLPDDLKFVTLDLRFSTRGRPLGTFAFLRPPLPEIGLPIFARHWRLEMPPGYATCGYDQGPQAASFSLRRCLLGPLGRSEGQSVFNPLRGEDWESALRGPGTKDRPADPGAGAETAGWTQFPIDLDDGASRVIVVRRAAVDAGGWVLFLAIVAIGAWGLSGRPYVLLTAAVVLGLPALLLPEAISAIFSHGLLGVMFCLILGLVRRRTTAAGRAASDRRKETPSTVTSFVPFGAPLLAAVMLYGWGLADAAEPPKSAPVTYSVFIPVDAKQQPTKGKYYVPESIYGELYRRAAVPREKPQGWLIASAAYRATMTEAAARSSHRVERLTAAFEVHVFNARARVRVPLRRDEVSLEPGQAQLDGRPVQPEWELDGSALLLDIAEPGEYRLALTLRPTVPPGNRPSGFDLAVPRVPVSRLELTVPAGGPQVEFPTALGAVRWEEVMSRWTAELGPSDRLAARWPDAAPAGAGAVVDAEQLLWLKIEPGCVLLDVRIKAKAAAGQIRRLLVRADSALELLPANGPAAPAVSVVSALPARGGDASQTYEVRWPQSAAGAGSQAEATVDLHFLWSGASNRGALRVPQIEVVDARPMRRSLAVSIAPALEYQVTGARPRETGAVSEFINDWGGGDSTPGMAFRLNENVAEWGLVTQARQARTSGDQNARWSFNARTAEVQFDAQLTTAGGSLFQYRLDAPPALRVESVAVLAEGANQAARWSRNQDGQISVFLARPLSGRHEFRLHGQMPLPGPVPPARNRVLTLPKLRLAEVKIQNSLVALYRRPDVLIEVAGVAGLPDVKAAADDGQGDWGRPVRSFYADAAATSPVQVTVRANRPRVRAEQVTRVECEENQWRTTCEIGLRVSAGSLDAVELDVPAAWKDSVQTSPDMPSTFAASSDEWISLTVSPSAAIAGDFKFTLTGPPVAAARFAVPKVVLKRSDGLRKYVVLPNSVDHQAVAWSLQNLRRSNAKGPVPEDTVRYEVVGEPWQAMLLPPRKTAAATRVVQADVRYAWQADGRCLGAAFLDLETAATIDCPLELPPGFELLQLAIDGLPVDATRQLSAAGAGEGTWTVPLASQTSTARVEVLFFAESAIPRAPTGWPRRYTFRAPKLGDLPVERTAWTIAAPRAFRPAAVDAGRDLGPPSASGLVTAGDIAAQWQRFVAEGQSAVFSAADGPVDAVALEYRPIEALSWVPRLTGIMTFLAAVGLAALLVRWGALGRWFARRPYVFGVGFGLAWWLWLSPSAVGLLIVLAVLLGRFLPWRRFPRAAAVSPSDG
jgi:hypothetical protein